MTTSMTGFAVCKGAGSGYAWVWDIRSVNGKGFDLRLRLPDWIDGLEAGVRAAVQPRVARGTVSVTLRLSRDTLQPDTGLRVNPAALGAVLAALAEVEATAMHSGVTLRQSSTADVLAMRGVLETAATDEDTAPLRAALLADLSGLLDDFARMRAAEGLALHKVIEGQLDQIAALTRAAGVEAEARRDAAPVALREALARVLDHADGTDPARVAQELALIAVRQDVTEELDRLSAHVEAARVLMRDDGPVGRKIDFLMQEFMREANTLCSKAQSLALTRIGLDLKTVIDQMREQVQNVE